LNGNPATPADERDREAVSFLVAGAAVLMLGVLTSQSPAPIVPAGWQGAVTHNLAQRGYDWIELDVADGVVLVTGEAPDVDSRLFGVEAAQGAVHRSAPENEVRVVIDATTMEGAAPSVGAALPALGRTPSAEACQAAFASTLERQPLAFQPGAALLTDAVSVLDALAGVAIRCRAHHIEIGAGSDRASDPALGQARANAVRQLLVDRGAPSIEAKGRGADAGSPDVEFVVTAR
jgi:hypothetical protein